MLNLDRNTCPLACETITHILAHITVPDILVFILCLVPTQGKVWPFLILTSVHLLPSFVYFHDHLQFMSSFSHCVLLWQDNSISLIQYALCLYLHAPVTVPLVREGVVFLSLTSSEVSSPPFVFELILNSILLHITQRCIFGFLFDYLQGKFACSQMWGEYRKQRDCLHAFTNRTAKHHYLDFFKYILYFLQTI